MGALLRLCYTFGKNSRPERLTRFHVEESLVVYRKAHRLHASDTSRPYMLQAILCMLIETQTKTVIVDPIPTMTLIPTLVKQYSDINDTVFEQYSNSKITV